MRESGTRGSRVKPTREKKGSNRGIGRGRGTISVTPPRNTLLRPAQRWAAGEVVGKGWWGMERGVGGGGGHAKGREILKWFY